MDPNPVQTANPIKYYTTSYNIHTIPPIAPGWSRLFQTDQIELKNPKTHTHTLAHTLEKRSKHESGQQVEVEIEEEAKAESGGKINKSNGKAGR